MAGERVDTPGSRDQEAGEEVRRALGRGPKWAAQVTGHPQQEPSTARLGHAVTSGRAGTGFQKPTDLEGREDTALRSQMGQVSGLK